MIISITIPDVFIREAQEHGKSVVEYVEMLIDAGHHKSSPPPGVDDAISRIRALREGANAVKNTKL